MARVKFEFVLDDEAAMNICDAIQKEINHMRYGFLTNPDWSEAQIAHLKRAADLMEKDLETMCKGSSKVD